MTEKELNNWFCSLTIKQKEHIACKILLKHKRDAKEGLYPKSVLVWNELDTEKKNWIHSHCTDKHGMWIQEAGDAPFYSF